jgi:uncharacterized protein (DUF1800 family)
LYKWLTLLAAIGLSGCGSGAVPSGSGLSSGSGSGQAPGSAVNNLGDPKPTGQAQSLTQHRDALSHDEAYHLLRRAAFGATPERVQQAVNEGLRATVEDLLEVKHVPQAVQNLADEYKIEDMDKRWLVYLIESPNPLQERLTLFWHDRFATSRRVLNGRDKSLGNTHWEMLRRNALGNYRTFLQELTIDPLMLIWLNGADSPKEAPNENYAREFWELFTLGRDVLYTEADIKEAAKGFTGIRLLREDDQDARPVYDILNHDESLKNIFPGREQPANYDYLSMVDLTVAQPEAQRYVAHNLFALFVHDQPSDAILNELADDLQRNNYAIKPVVRRILMSEAMFAEDARRRQITSPVEHIIGVARTLDMHIHSEDSQGSVINRLRDDLRRAGHQLLNPPSVEGWGENAAWLKSQSLIHRAQAIGRTMEYGPDRTPGLPYHLLPPVISWDDRNIRDRIINDLADVFHVELTDEERAIYIEVLDQDGWRAFHLEEPDRQPKHVFELIRLFSMHEDVIGS